MSGNQPPAAPPGERPVGGSLPAKLDPLVETARAYASAATSRNTNRAYAADWRDYLRWRARQGLDLKPLADPDCVGLYCAAMASGAAGGNVRTVATIESRLSALPWHFARVYGTCATRRSSSSASPQFARIARGPLRPEAPRPRVGGNDPPLPAAPRPLPGQSHQGGEAVIEEIGKSAAIAGSPSCWRSPTGLRRTSKDPTSTTPHCSTTRRASRNDRRHIGVRPILYREPEAEAFVERVHETDVCRVVVDGDRKPTRSI